MKNTNCDLTCKKENRIIIGRFDGNEKRNTERSNEGGERWTTDKSCVVSLVKRGDRFWEVTVKWGRSTFMRVLWENLVSEVLTEQLTLPFVLRVCILSITVLCEVLKKVDCTGNCHILMSKGLGGDWLTIIFCNFLWVDYTSKSINKCQVTTIHVNWCKGEWNEYNYNPTNIRRWLKLL